MSPEPARKISHDSGEAMKRPAFLDALHSQPDSRVVGSSPEEFRHELEPEIARPKRDLRLRGIEME